MRFHNFSASKYLINNILFITLKNINSKKRKMDVQSSLIKIHTVKKECELNEKTIFF